MILAILLFLNSTRLLGEKPSSKLNEVIQQGISNFSLAKRPNIGASHYASVRLQSVLEGG